MVIGTDAFTLDWAELRAYANPDWQGPGRDSLTASRACSGGTSVEGTGLVPSATGDVGGHFTPDPPGGESDNSHTHRQPPRGSPPTSLVGYLRQCYHDYQVSEGATKLLAPSVIETKVLQDVRLTLWKVGQLV